ncbi:transposase [Prevotella rectalis]|nr:transposase [Prevotella brunnea]
MYKSPSNTHQVSMFWDLASMLNPTHPMYKLANLINWETFERSFAPLYCKDNGRMAKPIRLMVGLIVLKHIRNVSDESVVEQFSENAYYQYFCGMESFTIAKPCVPTELVEFRHRIGEAGMELILKESIRANLLLDDKRKENENRNDGKDGRGRKSDTEQTAFIDSTVQEKNVTFPTDSKLLNKIIGFCRDVAHAEHLKVRQSYAGEIKRLKLVQRFRGRKIKRLAGDRGYRGQETCGETNIMIPGVPKASDSPHKKKKKQMFFRKRAGIEPVIGHCKADHRLGRNFYKGLLGDAINVMLAAAAFNFKRAMRFLLCLIRSMIKWSIQGVDSNFNETKVLSNTFCWL